MPLLFRKDKTQAVSLAIDSDIDEAQRPAFLCRGITEAEADDIETEFREAIKMNDTAAATQRMRAALATAVTGWRNMPPEAGAYAGADSLGCLTVQELGELQRAIVYYVAANGPFTVGASGSPT